MKIQKKRKPAVDKGSASSLKKEWGGLRAGIESRLGDFKTVWRNGSEHNIFNEMAFCIFTPQSKAKNCWEAVKTLEQKGLLHGGTPSEIARVINKVRFRNNKAKYLVKARNEFFRNGKPNIKSFIDSFGSVFKAREWLVANVMGMGYKEASHFLRNIGLGDDIAILDRHILKNLKVLGVIKEVPKTFTAKTYLEIEEKLRAFSKKMKIPMDSLDLLFWQRETGEVFK